jgi:hypothetical protein
MLLNPAFVPIAVLIRHPWLLRARFVPRLFCVLRPLLSTQNPKARLRLTAYRGLVTATMCYDALPINDVFRKVDDYTLVGAMDLRGLQMPFVRAAPRAADELRGPSSEALRRGSSVGTSSRRAPRTAAPAWRRASAAIPPLRDRVMRRRPAPRRYGDGRVRARVVEQPGRGPRPVLNPWGDPTVPSSRGRPAELPSACPATRGEG